MKRRVIFNSKELRDLFFKRVIISFGLAKIKDLRLKFDIPKSTFELYLNGNLTMPEELYNQWHTNLQKSDLRFFKKKIEFLDSDWGRVKAGKITYAKYKSIFDEGRKKAIRVSQANAKKFDMGMHLSKELAYFLGLFIGDGFTNKYQRYYLIQFTGDKRTEKAYYQNLVSKYSKQLFNLIPVIREEKIGNGLRFNLYSKQLFNLITQRFKIVAGRKSRTVLIPKEILNSKSQIIKACISGLYDAEGCVFFDKRKAYTKPYPRIDLHMLNPPLIKQIIRLLNEFLIPCSTNKDFTRILIYGNDAVKKFVKEIGFSNPKHLEKLRYL